MLRPYYDDGVVTLFHGDMRAILPALGQVDHVITDPPYDAQTHAGARRETAEGIAAIDIDFAPLHVETVVPLLLAAARRWVVAFCALEQLGAYRDIAGSAYVRGAFWHRVNGSPQFTGDRPAQPGEGIAVLHASGVRKRWNGGGKRGYYTATVVQGVGRVHPTQKPEALMRALIEDFTDPGESLLDPFAGSGTTLVAAKRLGRRVIGIEQSQAYCDAIVARLGEGPLFALPSEEIA